MPSTWSNRFLVLLLAPAITPALRAVENADKSPAEAPDSTQTKPRPQRTTPRDRAAARRAARESATKAKRDQERSEWLARLKARDVEPWPEEETDEEHADALAKSREMVDEVVSLFPGTQLVETNRFLFVSNIPPQQVGPYIASLDKMYDWMCQLYGVPRDHKVWLGGKAPIFAFLEHAAVRRLRGTLLPRSPRVAPHAREHLRPEPPQMPAAKS